MKLPTLKNEYELNRWMRDRLSCTETTTFICPFNIATYFAILAHMSLHFWKNKQGGTTEFQSVDEGKTISIVYLHDLQSVVKNSDNSRQHVTIKNSGRSLDLLL